LDSEVLASGFSVLPPQGENWCVSSMAAGFFFFKYPASVEILAQPPSTNNLFQVVLQAVRFMGSLERSRTLELVVHRLTN
jgi:hypothetical protein